LHKLINNITSIHFIGCVRVRKNWGDGCISQVITPVKQVFQLIRASSFESQEESRFQYFKESVLNQVLRLNQAHTLIVTPSYLSFIRVRNELIRREVRGVCCAVLCCAVLCCAVLCCAVLCCDLH
jgi:Utp25, U3 small nucleolar RNA-associated SSU processome protein 25